MASDAENGHSQQPESVQFSAMPLREGAISARDQGKFLVLYFSAAWSAPARRMEKITWRNDRVAHWIDTRAVAFKIDAENDQGLTSRLKVLGYPTTIVFSSSAEELARFVGFVAPNQFLQAATEAIRGKEKVAITREKAEAGDQKSPMDRMNYARLMQESGRYEEALAEFLWCFDEGHKHDPAFRGVRLSCLLKSIRDLGAVYPPAIDALQDRRDRLRIAIFSSALTAKLASEFASINRCLGEQAQTLEIYDQLRRKNPRSDAVKLLCRDLFEMLCERGRFAEIADGMELADRIGWETDVLVNAPRPNDLAEELHRQFEEETQTILHTLVNYYAVLNAAARYDDAAFAAKQILAIDPSPERQYELISAAAKLKHPAKSNGNGAKAS